MRVLVDIDGSRVRAPDRLAMRDRRLRASLVRGAVAESIRNEA